MVNTLTPCRSNIFCECTLSLKHTLSYIPYHPFHYTPFSSYLPSHLATSYTSYPSSSPPPPWCIYLLSFHQYYPFTPKPKSIVCMDTHNYANHSSTRLAKQKYGHRMRQYVIVPSWQDVQDRGSVEQ